MIINKKLLIISAHPDDETLGCGGTILKYKKTGNEIFWLIVTNIDTANGWEENIVVRRQNEIQKVTNKYSFNKVFKLDYPTTKLDTVPFGQLVSSISKVIKEIEPQLIFVVNRTDIHSDHRIVFDATYSCTKNFRSPSIEAVFVYECLSETEFSPPIHANVFVPNVFINVTDYFKEKIDILKIYDSEIMQDNFPRNLEVISALSRFRGSRIGVKYAEAFSLMFMRF